MHDDRISVFSVNEMTETVTLSLLPRLPAPWLQLSITSPSSVMRCCSDGVDWRVERYRYYSRSGVACQWSYNTCHGEFTRTVCVVQLWPDPS